MSTENFEVKIIKLKTGEDLIGFYHERLDGKSILKYPKIFYYWLNVDSEEEEIMMNDWLMPEAYATQEVVIPSDQILLVSYPIVSFGYRYLDSVLEYLDPDSKLAQQIKQTIIESIDPEEGSSIH